MRAKKKILIVEDDKLVRTIVVKFLSKYYDVWPVGNGEEGRDVCKTVEERGNHFDAILCDQGMPIMTGLEMYETLDAAHQRRFILWTGDERLQSPSGRKMVKGSSAEDIFECVKTAIFQTKHRPPQRTIDEERNKCNALESAIFGVGGMAGITEEDRPGYVKVVNFLMRMCVDEYPDYCPGLWTSKVDELDRRAARPQLSAWTDYPLKPLGDEGGKAAPVRKVTVLTYDRNKYCTVEFTDKYGKYHLFNFKRGYLYKKKGRLEEGEEIESWSHDECHILPTSLDEKFESEIQSV